MVFGFRLQIAVLIFLVLFVQISSAGFFVIKILSELLLIEFLWVPWQVQELLEILSSFGLLFGVVSSVVLLINGARRATLISDQLQAVSGDFYSYVDRQFELWRLTSTERHVAILVIKGFSNGEIARLRGTTESTVKSQLSSIFRKSGLCGRQQLVSHVIKDLVSAIPEK